jgi:sec-independent protein translocase protein TatA
MGWWFHHGNERESPHISEFYRASPDATGKLKDSSISGGNWRCALGFARLDCPQPPPLRIMGPIGMPEMIMIFVVILLLFGAKKLPELARGVGKSMGEFKKARDDFEREITRAETEVRVKDAPGKESQDS